tara:strand:+ start:770 stop:1006 length:237 start_codon:yes stop_codon:yes gene_type:complete
MKNYIEDVEVKIYFQQIPCVAYINMAEGDIDEVTILVPCDDDWNESSGNLLPFLNHAAQSALDMLIRNQLTKMKRDTI